LAEILKYCRIEFACFSFRVGLLFIKGSYYCDFPHPSVLRNFQYTYFVLC